MSGRNARAHPPAQLLPHGHGAFRGTRHDRQVPELTYYVDRVKLLVELTGGIGPSALKDMQCEQPEYAGAEWHSRIQTIDPRVRERLAVIDGRGVMTTSAPGGTPAQRVAARRGIAVSHVEEAMATHGVAAVATPAAPRSMRVRRLRITGTKDESGGEGAFDRNFAFPTRIVMIVGSNRVGCDSVTWDFSIGTRIWLLTVLREVTEGE
ncbi:MAG: hypothetical protein M3Q47_06305 [Actinomycetota bacterium]|nr:hypothetical protein [Actinomycetota bacterium]